MSLPLLPAELKLNIFHHLDPGSALPFALSSRAHFRLCEDKLQQHAKLSAKYSIIRPNDEGHLIWEITKEILQDPRKGWYVRELNLVTNRPDEYQNMPEEDRIFFKAAVERILPLYPYAPGFFANERSDTRELSDEMDADLRRGFEASILVLLIHHSPQLRTFRMTDNLRSDTFQLFMRWVAAGYQNPSMASQMPLQHLRLAAIAHHDTEGFCSVDWAVYFLCIPSLKTFAALMMGSEGVRIYGEDGEADLRIAASAPVSNVEELFFQGCQFDPDSFETILPIIKNLKRFSYDAGGHAVAQQNHEPKKVIRALVNHTADSLEELNLVDDTMGFVVSATKYMKLVTCSYVYFRMERKKFAQYRLEVSRSLKLYTANRAGYYATREIRQQIPIQKATRHSPKTTTLWMTPSKRTSCIRKTPGIIFPTRLNTCTWMSIRRTSGERWSRYSRQQMRIRRSLHWRTPV
jgi:hypothetical protein